MPIPILLRAKMSLRFLGLTALRTDRTPTRDNFHAPARQHTDLCPRRPKTDDRGSLLILFFCQHFFDEQYDQITILVIAETDLSHPKERIDRRIDSHHFLDVIARGF